MFALEQEGRTLSEAMIPWSGNFERPLLVAAASSGATPGLFRSIIRNLESHLRLRGALAGVFGNVGMLVGVIVASAVFLAYYFVPQLLAFMDVERMGVSTRSLVHASLFFRSWWPAIGIGGAVALLALLASLPTLTGSIRDWFDRFEPFRSYRTLVGGSFLTAVATLFQAGLNERETLSALRKHSSPYLAYRIRRLEQIDMTFGQRIFALEDDWPDYETKVSAAFAAKSPEPAALFAQLGDRLIDHSVRHCTRMAAFTGWTSNFVLAALIVWVLLATSDISGSFEALSP